MRHPLRRAGRAAVLAAAVLALGVAPASGQRRAGPGGQANRAELEARVRARFNEMVKQRLGLSDDQARQLDEAVRGFQQDRMQLSRDEQALRKRVEALILEGGDNQAEARDLLDRMQELRDQEARLSRSEQDRLLQVLTPMQLLQLQALREEMGRRIQRLRGGRPGPPGRDGPGGGPPGMGAPGAGPGTDDPFGALLSLPER